MQGSSVDPWSANPPVAPDYSSTGGFGGSAGGQSDFGSTGQSSFPTVHQPFPGEKPPPAAPVPSAPRPAAHAVESSGEQYWQRRGLLVGLPALAMVAIMVADTMLPEKQQLYHLCIYPRTIHGLVGVLVAPFVHFSWAHLLANLVPFIVLGLLVTFRSEAEYIKVSAAAVLLGGLCLWALGRPDTVYAGASGVIFSYWGFILAMPFFEPEFQWLSVAVAVGVGIAYSGLVFGFIPQAKMGGQTVAWEAHLAGFLVGILWAWITANWLNSRQEYEKISSNDNDSRDIF